LQNTHILARAEDGKWWSADRARAVARDVIARFVPGEKRTLRLEDVANGKADEESAFRALLTEIAREALTFKRADVADRDALDFVNEHVRDVQRLALRDKEQSR